VRSTGEVGRIRVTKLENKGKGKQRVRLDIIDAGSGTPPACRHPGMDRHWRGRLACQKCRAVASPDCARAIECGDAVRGVSTRCVRARVQISHLPGSYCHQRAPLR
jgi:hypothetical protein